MKSVRTPNAVFKSEGNLVVWLHGEKDTAQAEFDVLIQAQLEGFDPLNARVLVYSFGGGITPVQRKQLSQAMSQVPTALMTDSIVVRGIGTAVSWFNPRIATFATGHLEKALDHLKLSGADRQAMKDLLRDAQADLKRPLASK